MSETLEQGWGNPDPLNSRSKFHYFGKDGRALCGKWLRFLTPIDSDDNDDHKDNCAGCKKKIAKHRQKKAT